MSTLLAAVDDDQCAEPVLRTSYVLASLIGAEVRVLHVCEPPAAGLPPALAELDAKVEVTHGPAVDAIVGAASGVDVVAVALGTRGAPEGPQPAGHTALGVMARIDKPVAAVPPEARPLANPMRLLVPLEDGATLSEPMLRLVALARDGQLEIVVAHVHARETVPAFSDHAPHATIAWDRQFLARHVGPPHQQITLQRRLGVPAEEICALADSVRADLVVLTWGQDLSPGHAEVVIETLSHSGVSTLLLPTVERP